MNNPKNSLPNGWSLKKLGEIAKIQGGFAFDSKDSQNEGIKWLKIANVGINQIVWEEKNFLPFAFQTQYKNFQLNVGDVVIALTRPILDRKLKIAILSHSDVPALLNQRVGRIECIGENSKKYIYYLFQHDQIVTHLLQSMAGTDPPNLSNESVYSINYILPPLPEQQKIATILGTWDAAIQTTTALLAALQKRKKGLMQQLLSPKSDWKEVRLGECFERLTRRNTEGNTNVLTISAQHGLISQRDFFNKLVASEDVRGYFLLKKGEFAYNKSYSTGYPWGAYKRLDDYEKGILSPLYICFSLKNGDSDFFVHFFEAGRLDKGIYTIAQEGARNHGLLNMSVGDFFNLRFTIPPLAEQTRIAAILNAADAELRQTEAYLEKLKTQKRGLMQQLLTGKVRVTTT